MRTRACEHRIDRPGRLGRSGRAGRKRRRRLLDASGQQRPSWTVYKKATWYGPGFWGNDTACGMKLAPTTIGTAHKKLPCGTQVTFTHEGRSVAATVIDRGPYNKGYAWDLTKKTAKRVGFLEVGAGKIQATVTPG